MADPTRPFISLPNTRAGNSKVTLSKFFCAKKRGVINAIKDIEYPTSPRIAIFLLPYLSLILPQNALVVAHAKADIAKIEELKNNNDYLNDVLNEGAKKARLLAQEKILAIKEIIGISKIN